jgi:hypothetical protein
MDHKFRQHVPKLLSRRLAPMAFHVEAFLSRSSPWTIRMVVHRARSARRARVLILTTTPRPRHGDAKKGFNIYQGPTTAVLPEKMRFENTKISRTFFFFFCIIYCDYVLNLCRYLHPELLLCALMRDLAFRYFSNPSYFCVCNFVPDNATKFSRVNLNFKSLSMETELHIQKCNTCRDIEKSSNPIFYFTMVQYSRTGRPVFLVNLPLGDVLNLVRTSTGTHTQMCVPGYRYRWSMQYRTHSKSDVKSKVLQHQFWPFVSAVESSTIAKHAQMEGTLQAETLWALRPAVSKPFLLFERYWAFLVISRSHFWAVKISPYHSDGLERGVWLLSTMCVDYLVPCWHTSTRVLQL